MFQDKEVSICVVYLSGPGTNPLSGDVEKLSMSRKLGSAGLVRVMRHGPSRSVNEIQTSLSWVLGKWAF